MNGASCRGSPGCSRSASPTGWAFTSRSEISEKVGLAMKDEHDALVRDWQQNAKRNEDAAFRFLRSLKMASEPEAIDALAGELHAEAFAKVDCTRCANCCKTMQPGLTDED